MAEVYTDRGTHHRSATSWVMLAVLAAIILAIVIAYVR
jgi:hypothetical protein